MMMNALMRRVRTELIVSINAVATNASAHKDFAVIPTKENVFWNPDLSRVNVDPTKIVPPIWPAKTALA